jgi:NADH dehydrogenase FAD-containing subunit
MVDPADHEAVIREARVPSTSVFFLGCIASRVTLLSQQRRALNLVDAILATDFVRTDGRVAIVGAGAAGVTAAAAFAVAAPELKQIDLFEKCDGPLHLQQESDR